MIVGSPYASCHSVVDETIAMPALGVTVLVSIGDRWVPALTVQNPNYVVELRPSGPAEFGLRDENLCQDKPGCPTRFATGGEGHWHPRLVVNAETWLDCLAAAKAVARRHAEDRTDADRRLFAAHETQMLKIYRRRYEESVPGLTRSEAGERETVFASRYDEPQEQEAADWRSDRCVTLS